MDVSRISLPITNPTITLALEYVGENYDRGREHHERRFRMGALRVDEHKKLFGAKSRRPWVARLGWEGRFTRDFLNPRKSFRHADRKGERGVMLYFHLPPGPVFELSYWEGYDIHHRHFARVQGGHLHHLSKKDAIQCLKKASA